MKKTKNPNGNSDNPVRIVRGELDLLQHEFAEKLGCEPNYISMIERGVRPLSFNMAERISEIAKYPAPIEWLMGKTTVRNIEEQQRISAQRTLRTFQRAYQQSQIDYKNMFDGLCLLAKANDYVINPAVSDNIDASISEYTIENGDLSISLSTDEMFALKNHIANIVEAQLAFLFKLKGGSAKNG